MAIDVQNELVEIGKLMKSASLLMAVHQEISRVKKRGFVVSSGKHSGHDNWEVVVDSDDETNITRRIRSSIKGVEIERLAKGVIGIRHSGRSR